MEFCQERGLHFISDEMYALTQLQDVPVGCPRFVSALSLTEPLVPEGAVKIDPSRVHIVWAASKLFGSSGFRIVSDEQHGCSARVDVDFLGLLDITAESSTGHGHVTSDVSTHQ